MWVKREEIAALARYLQLSEEDFRRRYVRRVGPKLSLIEKRPSNDCIFLSREGGRIGCEVYPVRPMQCRTWPFWPENLKSANTWNAAATDCPGINRGRLYPLEEIERLRGGDDSTDPGPANGNGIDAGVLGALNWIHQNLEQADCWHHLEELYVELDEHLAGSGGICEKSGRCCRFTEFDHRLYVSSLELGYFIHQMAIQQSDEALPELRISDGRSCPYQQRHLCTVQPARPAGCRIFFCQGISSDGMSRATESVLTELRVLHEQLDCPYVYQDWRKWLDDYARWKGRLAQSAISRS